MAPHPTIRCRETGTFSSAPLFFLSRLDFAPRTVSGNTGCKVLVRFSNLAFVGDDDRFELPGTCGPARVLPQGKARTGACWHSSGPFLLPCADKLNRSE
jgi:hypothetical protein